MTPTRGAPASATHTPGAGQPAEEVDVPDSTAQRCVIPEARGICAARVPEGAPFPVCQAHLASAWQFCNDMIGEQRRKETAQFEATRGQRMTEALDEITELRAELKRQEAEHKAELERIREQAQREALALAASVEATTSDCVVYYLRFGDRVKIGYTKNVAKRRTQIPNDELLATEPGGRVVETMRHRQFAEHRLIGEWFAMGPNLMEHIEQLRAPGVRRAEQQCDIDARRVDQERAAAATHQERTRDQLDALQSAGRRMFATAEDVVPQDPKELLTRAIGEQ